LKIVLFFIHNSREDAAHFSFRFFVLFNLSDEILKPPNASDVGKGFLQLLNKQCNVTRIRLKFLLENTP